MGKKSTPPPPDYEAAAEATAKSGKAMIDAQTVANRPDQYTPWGNTTWENNGDNWTQTINLSPEQQEALDNQMTLQRQRSEMAQGMFDRVGQELGGPMDWSQFPEYQTDLGTGMEARQQAIDEMYNQATSRLDPMWQQRREMELAQLKNQGLDAGDEAFNTAQANTDRAQTDAYNQAMFSAIKHGGQEGQRVFGMDKESAAFNNLGRQSMIAEEMQKRGFSLNEINALLTGQQVNMPGMPSFSNAGAAAGADYLGAANMGYQAEMDAYSAKQAGMDSAMGAASSLFMFSDRRLKRDIIRIGSFNGHKFYSWKWIWGGDGFGVMADEVPQEYVAVHPSGYLMVDYGRL